MWTKQYTSSCLAAAGHRQAIHASSEAKSAFVTAIPQFTWELPEQDQPMTSHDPIDFMPSSQLYALVSHGLQVHFQAANSRGFLSRRRSYEDSRHRTKLLRNKFSLDPSQSDIRPVVLDQICKCLFLLTVSFGAQPTLFVPLTWLCKSVFFVA